MEDDALLSFSKSSRNSFVRKQVNRKMREIFRGIKKRLGNTTYVNALDEFISTFYKPEEIFNIAIDIYRQSQGEKTKSSKVNLKEVYESLFSEELESLKDETGYLAVYKSLSPDIITTYSFLVYYSAKGGDERAEKELEKLHEYDSDSDALYYAADEIEKYLRENKEELIKKYSEYRKRLLSEYLGRWKIPIKGREDVKEGLEDTVLLAFADYYSALVAAYALREELLKLFDPKFSGKYRYGFEILKSSSGIAEDSLEKTIAKGFENEIKIILGAIATYYIAKNSIYS